MLSTRRLAAHPFFADFTEAQLVSLAARAEELEFHEGEVLFRPEDELDYFYVLLHGEVGIFFNRPPDDIDAGFVGVDPTVVHYLKPGDLFSWSSLVPPYVATAGALVMEHSTAYRFDAPSLLRCFEREPAFGYLMVQKLARVIHGRLHQLRRAGVETESA